MEFQVKEHIRPALPDGLDYTGALACEQLKAHLEQTDRVL